MITTTLPRIIESVPTESDYKQKYFLPLELNRYTARRSTLYILCRVLIIILTSQHKKSQSNGLPPAQALSSLSRSRIHPRHPRRIYPRTRPCSRSDGPRRRSPYPPNARGRRIRPLNPRHFHFFHTSWKSRSAVQPPSAASTQQYHYT